MRFTAIISLLLFGCGAFVLAGCGQHAAPALSQSPSQAGRAIVTVKWPERTRVIPAAANCLRLALTDDTGFAAAQTVNRPADGVTSTVTFTELPIGTLHATVTAYPEANAGGVAQATGNSDVTTTLESAAQVVVNLSSTISRLVISPAESTLDMGKTLTCAVTAENSAGEIVPMAQGDITWTSGDPTMATVDAQTGKVTATEKCAGPVAITATETNSGCTQAMTVTVTIPPPRVVFEDTFDTLDTKEWYKCSASESAYSVPISQNGIQVTGGALVLTAADAFHAGAVICTAFDRVPKRILTITKRTKVHYNGDTCACMLWLHAGQTPIIQTALGSIGYYHYTKNGVATDGFTLGERDSPVMQPSIWDTWFDEVITYDPDTGAMSYAINGGAPVTRTMRPTTDALIRIGLTATGSGLSTGHEHRVDYLKVEWK